MSSGINPQTSYRLEILRAFAGDLSSTRDHVMDARRNDLSASAEAVFGLFVCKSSASDDLGFGLCNASSQALGVLVHSQRQEKIQDQTVGLKNGEFGNVMHEGRCWVIAREAVTTADPVRVCVGDLSGSITGAVEGSFVTTADSSGHKTARLLNARYLTSGSAGDAVEVEIVALPNVLTAD